jgi:hypothetical protein
MINLGIDYGALWTAAKQGAVDLVTKDLPAAAQKAVVAKAQSVAQPVVQQVVQAKAERAVSKGNVALFALGGVAIGALIAGGSWKRRAVGGGVVGALGALAGFKIGLLTDSQ